MQAKCFAIGYAVIAILLTLEGWHWMALPAAVLCGSAAMRAIAEEVTVRV